MRKPHWTPEEMQLAITLKEEGKTPKEIGARINRSTEAVKCKFHYESASWHRNVSAAARPPGELLNDRTNRLLASQQLSIIGRIQGDPPPGYSARDRRA